ncbi:MAG: hypothetical protein LBU28_01270 [Spirochaetaceae bacterium]|jgi:hypothetical protein|nr:hypothetical protein [Spirochaetaceae bacterium]
MKPSYPYKPALAALSLALAALLLATCPNPAISGGAPAGESGGADIPAGTGLAVIQLEGVGGGNAVRTAVPDHIDGYLFILSFTAAGKTDVELELSSSGDTSVTVPLEQGTWNLTVDAYTTGPGSDFTFKKGETVSITIKAETTTVFSVYMELDTDFSGTGTLTYEIEVPASTRGWLGLYPLDVPEFSGDVFGLDSTVTTDDTLERDISNPKEDAAAIVTSAASAPDGIPLPGGTYRAVIDLYNEGANKFAVYSTIVHIYKGQATPLNRRFTLEGNFADCPPVVGETGTSLAAKLNAALASTEADCTIVLEGNEYYFPPYDFSGLSGDKTITIRGNGKTIQLGSVESILFTLPSGLTLVLHDVTLRGLAQSGSSTASLVRVEDKAILELRAGSRITESRASSGGGVYVGGTLAMIGGEISGNFASSGKGGGVYVFTGGTFTLSGGAVSRNQASVGGGVYVDNGGTLTLSGGAVSRTATGSGVCVNGTGDFTMSGGAISYNRAAGAGGGLDFRGTGGSLLSGGTVNGNSASSTGGGIYVNGRTVTMTGGSVGANTAAASSGGGVYVESGGTFIKQGGGTIYGSDGGTLKNTAQSDSKGHAVYVSSGSKKRSTTAGPAVDLDSATAGAAGGWD